MTKPLLLEAEFKAMKERLSLPPALPDEDVIFGGEDHAQQCVKTGPLAVRGRGIGAKMSRVFDGEAPAIEAGGDSLLMKDRGQ